MEGLYCNTKIKQEFKMQYSSRKDPWMLDDVGICEYEFFEQGKNIPKISRKKGKTSISNETKNIQRQIPAF